MLFVSLCSFCLFSPFVFVFVSDNGNVNEDDDQGEASGCGKSEDGRGRGRPRVLVGRTSRDTIITFRARWREAILDAYELDLSLVSA
jgi:hypothetical protein